MRPDTNMGRKIVFCVLFLWAMILYYAVHVKVECWIYGKCSAVSEALYEAFRHSNIFAWSTSLLLFVAVLYFPCRKCDDKNFSVARLLLCLFAIEVLWLAREGWRCPLSGFDHLPLFCWIIILLVAYIVANTVRCISNRREIRIQRCDDNSWTVDNAEPGILDSVRAQYADHIVGKLREVNNSSESFAIVIYSPWGTGKSTFLNGIRERLERFQENVLEFNPWNSQTPQQVVSDFLGILVSCISKYDSSLAKPIVKYSEMLEVVDVPKPFAYVSSLLSQHDESLSELKDHIIESLKRIQVPLYVLIDDLDRMNKEEVFAVVRLIRNTANFPYLKFVVACDYDYIKKLEIDTKYLEKIFMAEFHLPAIYAELPCCDACRTDILEMSKDDAVREFFENVVLGDKKLIEQSLGNLRQAKRFARALVTDWEFAKKNRVGRQTEIRFTEYFWIELLRHARWSAYQDVSRNPMLYFEVRKNNRYHTDRYVLKKEYESDDNQAKLEVQILQKIFPYYEEDKVSFNSVSLVENFDKYFEFGKAAGHVTQSDYVLLLHFKGSNEELSEKIGAMSNNELNSLCRLIMMTTPKKLRPDTKKAYIDLVLAIGYRLTSHALNEIIEHKLSCLLAKDDAEETKAYLLEKLKTAYYSYPKILASNHICISLLRHISNNTSQKEALEQIVRDNFKYYVSNFQCDAADILKKNTGLNHIVSSSMLATPVYYDYDDDYYDTTYENLIFDDIIEWFKSHKSSRLEEVKSFEDLGIEDLPADVLADLAESKNEEKIGLFGSVENYERFKRECFE